MKKSTFLACATLLTSAVLVTSCNNKDQNEPIKKTEVIKTEFAISLPEQVGSGPYRMPGTTVPESGTFYGIDDLTLVPFAVTGTDIVAADKRIDANIVLGDIATGAASLGANSKAKLFDNVSIPLGTASFLVYGKSAVEDADLAIQGELIANGLNSATPAGIEFQLKPIVSTTASVTADGAGAALITLLNNIADAKDGSGTPIAWEEYTATESVTLTELFNTYKTMHALSSYEVERVLTDLFASIRPYKIAGTEPYATLATNILTQIAVAADTTGTGTELDPFKATLKSGYTGFPENKKLPSGAVRIKYNAGAFSECTNDEYTAANQIPLDKYVYPSALWYYGNSTINTDTKKKGAALYDDTNSWATILAAYATSNGVVNSKTQSIAIVEPIQFAVGRLDVTVKLAETTLKDQANQDVAMKPTVGFPVTAVLIGNQKNVGFNFAPKGDTQYTIYDNHMKNEMHATTTASAVNSTLVLETPTTAVTPAGTADAAADVQIAIELQNNTGKDFIGANGDLIPAGGKFYLVAPLKASNATTTQKSVFIQDYTTTANLTINSLANAYNEIPDLRTPKLEVGVSVDLTWTAGSTYDVVIP